ncbi:hypothetical protein BCR42DRAFT_490551 [Absidia repens]|uniref:ATPase of the ABC class n=1 Tax=Absidia repens TaxID=90262 RepID=A0A1X2IJY0_9FUNG|nr:hypothetical protein BCR42DRAFT_490551 [Absidia repens]
MNDILLSLDGKSYGAYRGLCNYVFNGPLFNLMCTRAQSDPYAGPSTFSLYIHPEVANYPPDLYCNTIRKTALADYIGRIIERSLEMAPNDKNRRYDGSVKGGTFSITKHPQQVIERSDVVVHDGGVDFRFKFALPARGRTIVPFKAIHALLNYLPAFIEHHLLYSAMDPMDVAKFVFCVEDQKWIRSHLNDNGLVAFIPDGAILSRAAGDSDTPNLNRNRVVAFKSPESLKVSMTLPSGKEIQGMGIPPGITVITGGGYHGKSTLLRALEMGIYNHIPGDGREYLATDETAIKIRSEDGRWIEGVDVSPFINNLPFDTNPTTFSTTNASGSTSMAASIQEMVEGQSKLFLYDEDTCATNFLVSDRRMRQLIKRENEPIIPLVSRIKQLHKDKGVSSIMVTGVCFDFLDLADLVIEMRNYTASVITDKAKTIAKDYSSMSLDSVKDGIPDYGSLTPRQVLLPNYNCKVAVEKHGIINFKDHSELVMNLNEQLVEQAMTRSIKCGLIYLIQQQQQQQRQRQQPLLTVLDSSHALERIMDQAITKTPDELLGKDKRCFLASPLDTLCLASPFGQDMSELSRPPRTSFIYALNRLRGTKLQ